MSLITFPGRAALQQRVLPAYRIPFFDALAGACDGGMSVFAGDSLPVENIASSQELEKAHYSPAQNMHFMSPSSPLYRCRQNGIVEWLHTWEPNVLVVEANPRYISTPKAIEWMHARGKPVIGWGLGAPALKGVTAFWRKSQRKKLLDLLDAVIAYSELGAREYAALGMPDERMFVAYNAASFSPASPPQERLTRYTGRTTILFVGRLQERKRLDNLLLACSQLPGDLQPQLLVVGEGPAGEDLRIKAGEIYPSADFLGARHGGELDEIFNQSDLFVLPGTGGLAVQQAMASGLPVIVARGDGTQEDLVSEENGWLVPPDNPDALREALQDALSDVPRLRRMGWESYNRVVEKFNVERMVEVFVNAFRTVKVKSVLPGE